MIVHRFMGKEEYDMLVSGQKLRNTKHHSDRYKSESVGFSFFEEEPSVAVHWLSGIIYMDYCVTFEVDESLLTKCAAWYRDPQTENIVKRTEYSTIEYSKESFKIVGVTNEFESMYPPREFQKMLLWLFGIGQ